MDESSELREPPAFISLFYPVRFPLLGIVHLVIGAIYLYDCPAQHYIPIYLLVMGVVTLMQHMLLFCPYTARFASSKAWISLIVLFLFCWFITGNVWIFSIYEPNYNKTAAPINAYCNKTLYLFAYWITIAYCILFALYSCFRVRDDD
uniref:transmembrane protein 272-like n=1 Tax=Semicossyphus pulcher TaxID=241346 RepID=UPI0037E7121C